MSIDYKYALLFAVLGCAAGSDTGKSNSSEGSGRETDSVSSVPTRDSTSNKVTVLFFGTSLTAGYGLDPSIAFPRLIQLKSDSSSTPITAINAGLSGETSAGALRRIDWALRRPVDIVVIETGGNDALRALDPDSLEANIRGIVRRARQIQPSARIILVAMESPPNLGARYNARFRQAYIDAARSENVPLIPFLLDKVAGHNELNQDDGVHPNEPGERIVAENIWRSLEPIVREVDSLRRSR